MREVDHIVRISSRDLWARREPEVGAAPAPLAGAALEPVAPGPRPPLPPPPPLPMPAAGALVALLAVEDAALRTPNELGAAVPAAGALLVVRGAGLKRLDTGSRVLGAEVVVDAGAFPFEAPNTGRGALAVV